VPERTAARCFEDWLRARGGAGPAELRDGIAQVRAFLEAHGSSRFEPAWIKEDHRPDASAPAEDALRRTINRAGFRRKDGDGRWKYFVLPEIWRQEVCKGLDARAIAQAMAERGWLERGEGKNLARKVRVPEIGEVWVYVIKADLLGSEEGSCHAGR
jgi:uncharacterized protein (DUF927 family)